VGLLSAVGSQFPVFQSPADDFGHNPIVPKLNRSGFGWLFLGMNKIDQFLKLAMSIVALFPNRNAVMGQWPKHPPLGSSRPASVSLYFMYSRYGPNSFPSSAFLVCSPKSRGPRPGLRKPESPGR